MNLTVLFSANGEDVWWIRLASALLLFLHSVSFARLFNVACNGVLEEHTVHLNP